MENESLAKTRFLIIIDKNTDGNSVQTRLNHAPKHLSIQSILRGSYRTFQATPSFGVGSWCNLAKHVLLCPKELVDFIVCVLYLYMRRCRIAFNINIDIF